MRFVSFIKELYNHYDYLKNLERLSYDEIRLEQISRAKQLGKKFDIEIEDWKDFKKLPFTTKDQLRKYVPKAKNYSLTQTTGRTGEPFWFPVPLKRNAVDKATELRNWTYLGWNKQWSIRLTRGEPGRIFKVYNRLLFNISCKNYRTVNYSYVKLLLKKPFIIQGGTSAMRELAWLASKYKVKASETKCVVLGEDPKEHISALKEEFQDVYQTYGLAECVNVAFECIYHTLHVNMGNCIVESIDGELVITNLNNDVTPFIRYKTGDKGNVTKLKCLCGLETDVIINLQGKSIGFYADENLKKPLGWWMLSYLKNNYGNYIKRFRAIAYPKERTIKLLVIPKNNETRERLRSYLTYLSENTGYDVELEIVDEIEEQYKLFEVVTD
ncbi:MAG: hypothetical protein QXF82_08585 [Nitrososphaeria archaeon]